MAKPASKPMPTCTVFKARTTGVGVLDGDLALELGITGPILRASGVDHDLRRDDRHGLHRDHHHRQRPAVRSDQSR